MVNLRLIQPGRATKLFLAASALLLLTNCDQSGTRAPKGEKYDSAEMHARAREARRLYPFLKENGGVPSQDSANSGNKVKPLGNPLLPETINKSVATPAIYPAFNIVSSGFTLGTFCEVYDSLFLAGISPDDIRKVLTDSRLKKIHVRSEPDPGLFNCKPTLEAFLAALQESGVAKGLSPEAADKIKRITEGEKVLLMLESKTYFAVKAKGRIYLYLNKPEAKQESAKITYEEYKSKHWFGLNRRLGKAYVAKHWEELMAAQKKYRVNAGLIAATLGLESKFGRSPSNSYETINVLMSIIEDYPAEGKYRNKHKSAMADIVSLFILWQKLQIDIFSFTGERSGCITDAGARAYNFNKYLPEGADSAYYFSERAPINFIAALYQANGAMVSIPLPVLSANDTLDMRDQNLRAIKLYNPTSVYIEYYIRYVLELAGAICPQEAIFSEQKK